MVARYVLGGNWRFRGILASLGRTIELLPYDQQATGQLLSVGTVVSNKKSFVPLTHDESRNVHDWTVDSTHYNITRNQLSSTVGPYKMNTLVALVARMISFDTLDD